MEKLVLLKDLHSVKGTFKTTTANICPNTQSQKFRSTNNICTWTVYCGQLERYTFISYK